MLGSPSCLGIRKNPKQRPKNFFRVQQKRPRQVSSEVPSPSACRDRHNRPAESLLPSFHPVAAFPRQVLPVRSWSSSDRQRRPIPLLPLNPPGEWFISSRHALHACAGNPDALAADTKKRVRHDPDHLSPISALTLDRHRLGMETAYPSPTGAQKRASMFAATRPATSCLSSAVIWL